MAGESREGNINRKEPPGRTGREGTEGSSRTSRARGRNAHADKAGGQEEVR
jgi:hypothetical protein